MVSLLLILIYGTIMYLFKLEKKSTSTQDKKDVYI